MYGPSCGKMEIVWVRTELAEGGRSTRKRPGNVKTAWEKNSNTDVVRSFNL